MTRFTPPTQVDISLTTVDNHFKIAVSLKNPTDEPVTFKTMSGALLHISMETKGGDQLWAPQTGSTMAVTHWELGPNTTITRHFTVPNKEMAEERKQEMIEEFEYFDESLALDPYVETDIDEIIQIDAIIPSQRDYFESVTRQYDLRSSRRDLEDDLPPETSEGLSRIT